MRDLWNIAVGSWTKQIDGYSLVESLVAEYGFKLCCSGEILGGELEGAELGESGT